MKSLLKKRLLGDEKITEYSTIAVKEDIREGAYLQTGNLYIDISNHQWLLCLEPITIGIWAESNEQISALKNNTDHKIVFTDSKCNNTGLNKNTTATLHLNLFNSIEENGGTFFLLRLSKCSQHQLNFLKRHLLFTRYYKKPGLSFTAFKSLVAAYSYPRKVRLVSYREDRYYNIFPMDLIADISKATRYVFGLRHTNIALSKIIAAGKIVVSEISYEHKNIIYQLGKHHSSGPPPVKDLPFKVMPSKQYGFYIPDFADSYKEIKITKTISLGSHMMMWGQIINEEVLKAASPNLYHIHFLEYLHQKENGFNYKLA